MRDVYSKADRPNDHSTPACLHTVTPKRKSVRNAPGPPPLKPFTLHQSPRKSKRKERKEPHPEVDCEVAADAVSLDERDLVYGDSNGTVSSDSRVTVRGEEELPYKEYKDYEVQDIGDANGNEGDDEAEGGRANRGARAYCTLPRKHRGVAAVLYKNAPLPPRRTTPDGTDIYYWCDVPKKKLNGKFASALQTLLFRCIT